MTRQQKEEKLFDLVAEAEEVVTQLQLDEAPEGALAEARQAYAKATQVYLKELLCDARRVGGLQ